jgi:peptidyl-prolyl cis-trans isomerase SurA
MFQNLLFYIIGAFTLMPTPQAEPVLMNINGKTILRSQFEYRLQRDNKQNLKGKEMKAYLDNYVLEQIKVNAAEQAGLDTLPVLRNSLSNYRKRLIGQYINDNKSDEEKARILYNEKRRKAGNGEVQIVQIFQPLSQTASSRTIEAAKNHVDSIYSVLRRDSKLFDEMVRRFSAQKDTMWITSLDCPEVIEKHAFALSAGQFSEPFYSPAGIYIIKVLGKRNIAPFEEIFPTLIKQLNSGSDDNIAGRDVLERLKQEMNLKISDEAIKDLRRNGNTSATLFTLDGQPYTGKDFKRFAESRPMEISSQIETFINKSVLDRESKKIASKHPELQLQLKLFRDGLLAKEEDKIATTNPDSTALQNFFIRNQSDYKWAVPRFNGALVECINKRTSKKVKKLLKKHPQEEWDKLIVPFNEEKECVVMTKGLFKVGDNAFVDALAFGGPDYTPNAGFPSVIAIGKKQKAPTDYRDVKEKVYSDYKQYMEQEWIAHLKATTKVEISEEVLKTVNNH